MMLKLKKIFPILIAAPHLNRPPPPTLCADEAPTYELSLPKPLGILFEEGERGRGLVVARVLPKGSAAADGTIWPGDTLLAVGRTALAELVFDDAMAAIADAPQTVDLTLGRERGKVAAVRFADGPRAGSLVFARPGAALMPLAERCGFAVEYQCYEGSCGVCDMVLKDGESGGFRPVRFCKARIPKGSAASLMAWEVLRPESAEAQAFYEEMKDKLTRRARRQG